MYEVFEKLLQKHNVTSYKVSKATGVTQTALSNWKSGRSTPTTKTLQKIADYFGVTIVPLRVNNVFTPFEGIFVTNVLQIESLGDVRKHQ